MHEGDVHVTECGTQLDNTRRGAGFCETHTQGQVCPTHQVCHASNQRGRHLRRVRDVQAGINGVTLPQAVIRQYTQQLWQLQWQKQKPRMYGLSRGTGARRVWPAGGGAKRLGPPKTRCAYAAAAVVGLRGSI
jgi:hypothetical protein